MPVEKKRDSGNTIRNSTFSVENILRNDRILLIHLGDMVELYLVNVKGNSIEMDKMKNE